MLQRIGRILTRIGLLATRPAAFGIVAACAVAWLVFSPETFGWSAVASLATSRSIGTPKHSKLDELLRAHGEARARPVRRKTDLSGAFYDRLPKYRSTISSKRMSFAEANTSLRNTFIDRLVHPLGRVGPASLSSRRSSRPRIARMPRPISRDLPQGSPSGRTPSANVAPRLGLFISSCESLSCFRVG